MNKPTIMVSSTFFDLRQIRADLAEFIEKQLGFEPLLSELPSFPIDPDSDTVENCRTRVEKYADILILVIGGRYGSVDTATDKSVTNLEYIEARKKRIPIYAFVEKGVLSIMSVWKQNKDADFSKVVDTTRVFEFIEQVRSEHKVWTVPFETTADIITQLITQFAYLFFETLQARKRLKAGHIPDWYKSLSANALRLVLEKSKGWEYRLFFQVWCDEISKRKDILLDYKAGVITQSSETVSVDSTIDWFQTRISEIRKYTESANHLLNISAQEAFGAPGKPGNDEDIVRTAKKMGELFEAYLEWTKRIKRAYVSEVFTRVAVEMARFPESVIDRLQNFPKEALVQIDEALSQASIDSPKELTLTLTFDLVNLNGYKEALEEAQGVLNQANIE